MAAVVMIQWPWGPQILDLAKVNVSGGGTDASNSRPCKTIIARMSENTTFQKCSLMAAPNTFQWPGGAWL